MSIRKIMIKILFPGCGRIVVASTGRSGSTMVFKAVADSIIEERLKINSASRAGKFIRWIIMGYVERLDALENVSCLVCKTHDELTFYDEKVRYLFVYGDPVESAASVKKMVDRHGIDWFEKHQFHLRAKGDYRDLFNEDVLNYKGQLDSWLSKNRKAVLCVEYDDLWDKQSEISEFLGVNLKLPKRRSRESVAEKELSPCMAKLRRLMQEKKISYEKAEASL